MASLNLEIDYFDHPKTKRLVRLLGKGSEVIPLRLWAYTARYFPADGRLTEISAQEIESECRWWGKSGDAVSAMLSCRFLDQDGETYVVHDWLDHEGHLMAFKERAKAGAIARWEKYASSNASSIPKGNASSNAPTSNTNRTGPTKPTERISASAADPEFPQGMLRFWNAVPEMGRRRSSKQEVWAVWNKQKLEHIADEVIMALEGWKLTEDWLKENGKFIKGIHHWLKNGKWKEVPQGTEGMFEDSPGFQPAPVTPEILRAAFGDSAGEP